MLALIPLQAALAQQGRPEAPPFNASQLEVQPPPAEGVAIRAGRMFDPKSGTNLSNQVIVIKGDRIVEVGPARELPFRKTPGSSICRRPPCCRG